MKGLLVYLAVSTQYWSATDGKTEIQNYGSKYGAYTYNAAPYNNHHQFICSRVINNIIASTKHVVSRTIRHRIAWHLKLR